MANNSTLDVYRFLDDDDIILSYRGAINPDVITSLITILENKINASEVSIDVKRRVVRVLVECFQNLYHHLDVALNTGPRADNNALIVVKQKGNSFLVRTGNIINEKDVVNLRRRIAMVNALNSDELRDLYRKKLEKDSFSDKGTAGLGFIEIARKSKRKLAYEVIEMDEDKSFFCLNVTIE